MSDANIYSFYVIVTVSFDTFAFSYYLDNFDSFNVQYDKWVAKILCYLILYSL